ncbi:MAG: hypothetical protein AVO39_05265 [delta proteobacterium MLS_D]|jgi:2-oxoglutarate ferredoxin oxidoreductase subunit delta|nr:MAG: hypothetical protein AVO39_05265 [delta proteobacterium MLS_D]
MARSRNSTSTRRGHILIERDTCKACGLCISVCPQQVIGFSDTLNEKGYYPAEFLDQVDADTLNHCTGCAFCAIICPDVAIEVYRD